MLVLAILNGPKLQFSGFLASFSRWKFRFWPILWGKNSKFSFFGVWTKKNFSGLFRFGDLYQLCEIGIFVLVDRPHFWGRGVDFFERRGNLCVANGHKYRDHPLLYLLQAEKSKFFVKSMKHLKIGFFRQFIFCLVKEVGFFIVSSIFHEINVII